MSDEKDPQTTFVKVKHAETGGVAEITQAAFDEVYSKQGWELCTEESVATEDSEPTDDQAEES